MAVMWALDRPEEGNVRTSQNWARSHSPVLADTDQYSACISLARCTASTSTCSYAAPDWEEMPFFREMPGEVTAHVPLCLLPPHLTLGWAAPVR